MTERTWIVFIICTAIVIIFLIEKVTEYHKERIRKERWERWNDRRQRSAEEDLDAAESIIGVLAGAEGEGRI